MKKTDAAHPCRQSGIYDYTPLLDLRDFDPTKDVLYDPMHTLSNVLRNFIKMLKGTRAPGSGQKGRAAPSGAEQAAADDIERYAHTGRHWAPETCHNSRIFAERLKVVPVWLAPRRSGRKENGATRIRIVCKPAPRLLWSTASGLCQQGCRLKLIES